MSFLPEKEIGNVICDWKIESVDVERDMSFTRVFLSWPLTECKFELGVSWKKSQLSGANFYVRTCYASTPYKLSGTISIVTAKKTVHELGQFENHRFYQNDWLHAYLNKDTTVSLKDLREFQCGKDILMPNNNLTLRIHLWKPSLKNEMTVKYCAHTRRTERKCSFEWILKTETDDSGKEYFTKYVTEMPREFQIFSDDKDYHMRLTLKFGKSADAHVLIELTTEGPLSYRDCLVKFKIDAIGEKGISKPLLNSQFVTIHSIGNTDLSLKTEALQELKSNRSLYYPKGYLKLHCNVTVLVYLDAVVEDVFYISDYQSPKCDTLQKILQEQNPSEDNLKDCMYTLFSKREFCDVTLCTEEKKFPCHKAVLCARSSVFKAMFENDMSEKENGLVHVLDVDTRALGLFLTALYTDRLDGVDWECALNVYAIADKYAVPAIQKMCTAFLLPKLSTSNVCEVLELADIHQDKELKLQVQEFVCKHAKEIIKSEEWLKLSRRNLTLSAEMMQLIISERL